jgi:hypothetical protein
MDQVLITEKLDEERETNVLADYCILWRIFSVSLGGFSTSGLFPKLLSPDFQPRMAADLEEVKYVRLIYALIFYKFQLAPSLGEAGVK